MTMTINEVANALTQMAHFFRVFKDGSEIAVRLTQAHEQLPEIEKRQAKLAELSQAIVDKEAEVVQKIADGKKKYEEFGKDIKEKLEKIQEAHAQTLKDGENKVAEIMQKIKNATDIYNELIAKQEADKKSRLDQLDFLIAQEELKLANTQKALEEIKAKI